MTQHRIWIELDRPDGMTDEFAERQCELATAMIARLMRPEHVGKSGRFWWDRERRMYNVTVDEAGGYLMCGDNGHWFNLEYLSGEDAS